MISIDTTTMLDILDYKTSRYQPENHSRSLFAESVLPRRDTSSFQVATIEISEDVSEAAGGQLAPPIWRCLIDGNQIPGIRNPGNKKQSTQNSDAMVEPIVATSNELFCTTRPLQESEIFFLPADFGDRMRQDSFFEDLPWWEVGNL
jgi:hypothetical protein